MDAQSGMGLGVTIIWMVILFGIMYFLMIRPQKKSRRDLQLC